MKKLLDSFSPYVELFTRVMVWFTFGLAVTIFLTHSLVTLLHPYSMDYGEGPLLDQAVRIHEGQPIYDPNLDQAPYTVTNYPPVYVGLLSLFNSAEHASLFSGRLLSTLSTLAAAYFLFEIVRSQTRDWFAGLVSAMLFLAHPYVIQWGSLMRIDMLALAFSLGGLMVIVRAPNQARAIWITAVLLTAAAYTRQSALLAAPLAAFVWLLFHDWKKALRLAVITFAFVAGLLVMFNLLTRGGFFKHIVTANVNTFNWDTVNRYVDEFSSLYWILSLVGVVFLVAGWKAAPAWRFAAPYLVGAALTAVTVGKIGSNVNYLLELVAALALVSGLALAWLRSSVKQFLPVLNEASYRNLASALLLLLVVFQFRSMFSQSLANPVSGTKFRVLSAEQLGIFSDSIQKDEGTVLVDEYMAMLPANGKSIYLQPFEMTQLANAGIWDQSALVRQIEDKEFSQIVIHHFIWPVYRERWTPEMLDAIFASYTAVDEYEESVVFKPNDSNEGRLNAELSCGAAAGWQAPTRGEFGAVWNTNQLFIYGHGDIGAIPVYAVADGLLYRFDEWQGAVAIQHEDPLQLGKMVWSFYGDMLNVYSGDELVAADFPRGVQAVPVRKGDLIGYQGNSYMGALEQPHLHFALVPADEDGGFPDDWMRLDEDYFTYHPSHSEYDEKMLYHAGDYLGILQSTSAGMDLWSPYRCADAQ
ncbi:MAG: glycosyltransferase family 39 protein [Anaerolineaceae bacterium]|nr:glycosyltransferase family 39 protein [Anaerolineaceae bacterium]